MIIDHGDDSIDNDHVLNIHIHKSLFINIPPNHNDHNIDDDDF